MPWYLLGLLLAVVVPRQRTRWAFGSAAGVAEGAVAVALEAQQRTQAPWGELDIVWICADEAEIAAAKALGFRAVRRASFLGLWTTLRAGTLVVTHGLGDVNRYGVHGAHIVQLWHGAPLKRIHFDSPVTTQVRGPKPLRMLLQRMYRRGAEAVSLYVAGSPAAAARLRTAFRVVPGKVQVLGDPRHDELVQLLGERSGMFDPAVADSGYTVRGSVTPSIALTPGTDPVAGTGYGVARRTPSLRGELLEAVGADPGFTGEILLYAPTWRDGEGDPDLPAGAALDALQQGLRRRGQLLLVRPHPLGFGAYAQLESDVIRLWGSAQHRDPTAWLSVIDVLITDYSSLAIDFALTERPVVWFAPDETEYLASRGLYEPYELTTSGRIDRSWDDVASRLDRLAEEPGEVRAARASARALNARFHSFRDGRSAARVVDAIWQLGESDAELVPEPAVFFESFYGTSASCNPRALDAEIMRRYPDATRYWSVADETVPVPSGAVPLLVGSRRWHAARRRASLVIVNDWLRFGFRRQRGQFVLQTWHGTMLKHLALTRPRVSVRTRLAILRERRRWSAMVSQNPHSSTHFRTSYAFRGPVLEAGYPRDDRLAKAVIDEQRHPIVVRAARSTLELPNHAAVVLYAPTWRDRGARPEDLVDLPALLDLLEAAVNRPVHLLVRGHSRAGSAPGGGGDPRVHDVSRTPDIADLFLAADVLVTDYSSVMFDASVARVPMLWHVPDLDDYRGRERGFTFDLERTAPGPLTAEPGALGTQLAEMLTAPDRYWSEYGDRYAAWVGRFNPWDDGTAAERVMDELEHLGACAALTGVSPRA